MNLEEDKNKNLMGEAILPIISRYLQILDGRSFGEGTDVSSDKMVNICNTIKTHAAEWPIDKTNRWIGFVQGVLITNGLLTVAMERELTRPLFHNYYKETNQLIPKSIEANMKKSDKILSLLVREHPEAVSLIEQYLDAVNKEEKESSVDEEIKGLSIDEMDDVIENCLNNLATSYVTPVEFDHFARLQHAFFVGLNYEKSKIS